MHSFHIVETCLVSGNYDSGEGKSAINPLKTEKNLHAIQFEPHREHRVRVERPVGDRSVGKWLFIVRFVLNT